jgi:hypothetical protein
LRSENARCCAETDPSDASSKTYVARLHGCSPIHRTPALRRGASKPSDRIFKVFSD